jgi:hypothetical protein
VRELYWQVSNSENFMFLDSLTHLFHSNYKQYKKFPRLIQMKTKHLGLWRGGCSLVGAMLRNRAGQRDPFREEEDEGESKIKRTLRSFDMHDKMKPTAETAGVKTKSHSGVFGTLALPLRYMGLTLEQFLCFSFL